MPAHLMKEVEAHSDAYAYNQWADRRPEYTDARSGFIAGASLMYQLAMDEQKKLLDEVEKALTEVNATGKQYGAQGYIEERDWPGLSDYYGSLLQKCWDASFEALQKLKAHRGGT